MHNLSIYPTLSESDKEGLKKEEVRGQEKVKGEKEKKKKRKERRKKNMKNIKSSRILVKEKLCPL